MAPEQVVHKPVSRFILGLKTTRHHFEKTGRVTVSAYDVMSRYVGPTTFYTFTKPTTRPGPSVKYRVHVTRRN